METNLQLSNEVWKDIPEFEGRYRVSSHGRIYSIELGRELNISICGRLGYAYVFLRVNEFHIYRRHKKFSLHRLVAKAFIPNKGNKSQVNHKNGIRNDNRIDNLEWVTCSENQQHSYKYLGRVGSRKGRYGVKHKPQAQIQCMATGKIMTLSEASIFIGVNYIHLSGMVNNRYPNWTNFIKL